MVCSVLFCDIKKDVCERMPVSTYELHVKSYVLIESRCVTWRARDVADVFALVLGWSTLSEPGFYIEEFRYVIDYVRSTYTYKIYVES